MRSMFYFCTLAAIFWASPTIAESTQPLAVIAESVPADAKGTVRLIDANAARAEFADFASIADGRHSLNFHPTDFGLALLFGIVLEDELGLSMTSVNQLAIWGDKSNAAAVMIGTKGIDASDLSLRLQKHGYQSRDFAGHSISFTGADGEVEAEVRKGNIFALGGEAARYHLSDGRLVYAATWPMLETILAPSDALPEAPVNKAILDAVYSLSEELGSPTQIDFIADVVTDRSLILAEVREDKPALSSEGVFGENPKFPAFERLALVQLQDGAVVSGAVVLAFNDATDAKTAERIIGSFGGRELVSVDKPVNSIFSGPMTTRSTEVNGYHIVFWTSQDTIKASRTGDVRSLDLLATSYYRFSYMLEKHDLQIFLSN